MDGLIIIGLIIGDKSEADYRILSGFSSKWSFGIYVVVVIAIIVIGLVAGLR